MKIANSWRRLALIYVVASREGEKLVDYICQYPEKSENQFAIPV